MRRNAVQHSIFGWIGSSRSGIWAAGNLTVNWGRKSFIHLYCGEIQVCCTNLLARFSDFYDDHLSCFPGPETSCVVEETYHIFRFNQWSISSGRSQAVFFYDGWG
jgi:hypothetical protein